MNRLFVSCAASALAALLGLVSAMVFGMLWWPPGGGVTLMGIGLTTAGCFAQLLSMRLNWPVSVFASGFGAMLACFFAASAAEVLPPGSIEWFLKGGMYGACVGLPVAAFLGPTGLAKNRVTDNKTSEMDR
ncbi:hypothetical protein Pla52n_35880 [Stieleria varia]|uniref:Uncharacterized protein n=1 Tax=Stieleria varia TaxID=2528005 RepID=A0A5C6ASM8_9BACT|nr:hypothetical protein Pla52n_35880 [Stieleria varia]